MANNNGRMIVYGNQDKNSAMYAAMFGGFDNDTSEAKHEIKKEEVSKPAQSKNTPTAHRPKSNVNSNFVQRLHLTPEEMDTKARTKTMYTVQNILKDFGDSVARTVFGFLVLYTEVPGPDGEEMVLKIEQDLEGSQTGIIISEAYSKLWEYIESQDSPSSMRRYIKRLVASKMANTIDFELSFDGKNIFARGDKKYLINMKWAVLDLLSKIYEEVEL